MDVPAQQTLVSKLRSIGVSKRHSLSVDVHALYRQARDVIDGDVLELGVFRPVLVKNEEQFLRSAEGEDWEENAPASLQN